MHIVMIWANGTASAHGPFDTDAAAKAFANKVNAWVFHAGNGEAVAVELDTPSIETVRRVLILPQ